MISLAPVWERRLGETIGQCRAARLALGPGRPPGILVAWSADFDVDPFIEMFFFPRDTLKLAVFTAGGELVWTRDLGRGVVPGVWFCPVLPFDLDGDGIDEIHLVGNTASAHPLSAQGRVLQTLDALTGEPRAQSPWPPRLPLDAGVQHSGMMFRNFLAGGHANGRPVLVAAQGTYGDLHLVGLGGNREVCWERFVPADAPGARGSHHCPVLDLDGSGVDVILYGERAIDLADGRERFCADRDTYRGHSDIVAPIWMAAEGSWRILTCRESDPAATPRICVYDAGGRRLWGAVDHGHIDMGWAAHVGPERTPLVNGIRIGRKTCGPDGRSHEDPESFTFSAADGAPVDLPFPAYRTLPIDFDGDGSHEFVRGQPSGDGVVFAADGRKLGTLGGAVALACHLGPWAGEQALAYSADGLLRLWRDERAVDSTAALARYAHPFYGSAARSSAVGYHWQLLGGL